VEGHAKVISPTGRMSILSRERDRVPVTVTVMVSTVGRLDWWEQAQKVRQGEQEAQVPQHSLPSEELAQNMKSWIEHSPQSPRSCRLTEVSMIRYLEKKNTCTDIVSRRWTPLWA
jgi:hypothetical protein